MANTPNLGLHQWGANDAFLREDFNEDNRKLDEVLRCRTGSYMGNGAENRVIELGCKPKLVFLMGTYRPGSQTNHCLLLLLEEMLAFQSGSSGVYTYTPPGGYAEMTEKGFRLVGAGLNATGYKNHYIAFY